MNCYRCGDTVDLCAFLPVCGSCSSYLEKKLHDNEVTKAMSKKEIDEMFPQFDKDD